VIKPVLKFFDFFIKNGANPNAKVDKLLKFRPEYTEEMRIKEEQFKQG
jgi:hypothetical protein